MYCYCFALSSHIMCAATDITKLDHVAAVLPDCMYHQEVFQGRCCTLCSSAVQEVMRKSNHCPGINCGVFGALVI